MNDKAAYITQEATSDDFTSLVDRLYVPLCYAANRFVNDKTAAEDIVQETFARLWELRKKEKQIQHIDNYLYMLVHNLALEWLRNRKMQEKYILSRHNKEINIFNHIVEADVAMQIIAEIEKLPPRSKRIMELTFQGFDNQQIAQDMNISVNSVKTLKYKSIDKLKAAFSSDILLKFLLLLIS